MGTHVLKRIAKKLFLIFYNHAYFFALESSLDPLLVCVAILKSFLLGSSTALHGLIFWASGERPSNTQKVMITIDLIVKFNWKN
jgi:hypothetical protein